jgi:predicted nuclease with TOPRIM domain
MASCIRGLVAIKDSQIHALTKERDELSHVLTEKKKMEYRQVYQLGELQKEKNEILAKMEACQAKYRKMKEDKEDIRQKLLVKNAADKITHSYINKLKVRFSPFDLDANTNTYFNNMGAAISTTVLMSKRLKRDKSRHCLRTKKGKNCKRREELNVFIFTLYF